MTQESFERAVLDGLRAPLAIIDGEGVILRVNRAWRDFGLANDGTPERCGVGSNYVAICEGATGECAEDAQRVAAAIRRVLAGNSDFESETYACHGPEEHRWFRVDLSPIPCSGGPGALLCHVEVTGEVSWREELERLHAEVSRLALVAQHTEHAAVVTDAKGRIEWINDGFTRITGYRLEEVVGLQPGHFLQGEETDPRTVEIMREAVKAGREFEVDVVNYDRWGRKYWLAIECRPIHDEHGEIARFIAIERDVTEELEQSRSLRLLKAAMDNASEAMFTLTSEGRLVDVNEEACARFGYSRAEMLSLSAWDLSEALGRESWRRFWRDLTVSERSSYRDRYRSRSGRAIPVAIAISLVEIDCVEYAVAFVRDISAQVAMERALEEERTLLRDIISTIPDEVFWKNRKSVYLGCNRAFARRGGLASPEEIVGKTDFDLPWTTDERSKQREGDVAVMTTGRALLRVQEAAVREDGGVSHVDCSKVPLRDEHGEVIGVLGVRADVTERRELEAQLAQTHKLESIGQLAAGIAHEINTPTQYLGDNVRFLGEVLGEVFPVLREAAKLVADQESDAEIGLADLARALDGVDVEYALEEIPRALEESLTGVQRVSSIVRAMKEFSHPGTEERIPIDLNAAVESTIMVATHEWKYLADVVRDLDPGLPDVACHPGEITQVLLNLIINAAHAIDDAAGDGSTGKGTITISTRRDGDDAVIRVGDTGAGIPEAIRNKVLDPFFTTKEVGRGTGQGLAIVYGVVTKKHGGSIDIDSETGRGTTVTIRLPIAARAVPAESSPSSGAPPEDDGLHAPSGTEVLGA